MISARHSNPIFQLLEIIQIVPGLPPAISGVGDYAYLLAKQLRVDHGINTRFIVSDPRWGNAETGNRKPETQIDSFPVFQLTELSAEQLLRTLSSPGMPQTVLLQYVGYGFEKRGCPVWLVRGLEKWRSQKSEVRSQESATTSDLRPPTFGHRLITMFHELYATGLPWQSSFWTSPVQRWVAQSLARMSEHCFTNLRRNVPVLQQMNSGSDNDFTVLPVFSNVCEPGELPDWNERPPRMVVFGSAGKRQEVYSRHQKDLESACQALGLNEIVDIGATVNIPTLAVRVSPRGILSPAEVSREMLAARAGFFAYPKPYLGKSGVFAGYAAYGLVPVTFAANTVADNKDGLRLGEHFISAADLNNGKGRQLKSVSLKVRKWYDGHSIKEQGANYGQIIRKVN